jgi:hypothetical protein
MATASISAGLAQMRSSPEYTALATDDEDKTEEDLWAAPVNVSGIDIRTHKRIVYGKDGFENGSEAFYILAKLASRSESAINEDCRYTLSRRIMVDGLVRVLRRTGKAWLDSEQQDIKGAVTQIWSCHLDKLRDFKDFFGCTERVGYADAIAVGVEYALTIHAGEYAARTTLVVVPPPTEPVRGYSSSFFLDEPTPDVRYQCRMCGYETDGDLHAMIEHLLEHARNKELAVRDVWKRGPADFFVDMRSAQYKTHECPNHWYVAGPFTCGALFPECQFDPTEDWKTMLDHMAKMHTESHVRCLTYGCGAKALITYKDLKTHAKKTGHRRFQGLPVAKEQFLKRSLYVSPFLCNCDSRSSQNWAISQEQPILTLERPEELRDRKRKEAVAKIPRGRWR